MNGVVEMRSSWSVGGVVYAGMAVPMMFGSVAFGDGFDGVVDFWEFH